MHCIQNSNFPIDSQLLVSATCWADSQFGMKSNPDRGDIRRKIRQQGQRRRLSVSIRGTLVAALVLMAMLSDIVATSRQRIGPAGVSAMLPAFVEPGLSGRICAVKRMLSIPSMNSPESNAMAVAASSVLTIDSSDYERVFSIDLPEGVCVGLKNNLAPSPDTWQEGEPIRWVRDYLHPKEVEYGINLSSNGARETFFLGRLAMRMALSTASSCYDGGVEEMAAERKICHLSAGIDSFADASSDLSCLNIDEFSILKDKYGRPTIPSGFLGSISHKGNVGVALVAEDVSSDRDNDSFQLMKGVGIDIEKASARKQRIEKRILTPNEINNLGGLEGISREEEVLLRFSLKESVYKAMHPLINHYVGFQEAEITPNTDGTATVSLDLKSGMHKNFGEISAHWSTVLDGDFFLSSASVTLRDGL